MIATGIKAKVDSYIDDVLNGDIIVCTAVRQAVERHVADLSRQSTDEFPYYFDVNHAGLACDFFPLMLKHTIGDYAGLPFELEPWQAFGVWCLFGWKRDADDSRRFRRFYWSMARKNGKSSLAAGIALYLAMLDINPKTGKVEEVAEVILSATKKEQVEKVIYAEIERMRTKCRHIESRSSRINRQITFSHNRGSIRCVGSERPYDGLNPLAVLMDELHEWREHHRKFYDTMLTGSGSRSQPIIGSVTTAGSDSSHIWLDEYRQSKAVLDGTIKDESLFAYVFELEEKDDILEESNWIKANPNLGVSVKLEYLREARKTSPVDKNRFARYHCNMLVASLEKAFDMNQWDSCEGELSDWNHADAIGIGFDLGGRDDLAAWSMVARFLVEDSGDTPLYRYEVKCRSYIESDTLRDLNKQPFFTWIESGLLQKCQHSTAEIRHDIIEACREYDVYATAFDRYNAKSTGQDLAAEGITVAEFSQSCTMFNEPILDFMKALRDGRVTHDGNPLLRWCASNAVIKSDGQDRWMFDKGESSDKIDPIVAMMMAFRMASLAPEKASGSLYIS